MKARAGHAHCRTAYRLLTSICPRAEHCQRAAGDLDIRQNMQAVELEQLAALVDARLVAYFEAARARSDAASPEAGALMDAVAALTLRGGKRLRAMALYAGYCAASARGDLD